MASGDPIAVDHGVFTISDGTLVTAINGLSETHPLLSGGRLYLLPVGEGQINLIEIKYEGAG